MWKIITVIYLISLIVSSTYVTIYTYNSSRNEEEQKLNYVTYSGTHHFSAKEYSELKDYVASPEYILKEKTYLLNSDDPVIEFKVKTFIENEFPWGERKEGETGPKFIDWSFAVFIGFVAFMIGVLAMLLCIATRRYEY